VHDGALRVGVFDASKSYGHARRARRVGYIAVIGVGGSEQLRRPTINFEEEFDQIWSSISGRSRHDLSRISDLGSISDRSRVDLSRISDLGSISSRSRSTEIKITSSSSDLPVKSIGRVSLLRSKLNLLLNFTGRLEELLVTLISVVRDQTEIDPISEIDPRSEMDPRSTAKCGQYSPKLLVGRRNFSRPPTRDRPEIRDQIEIDPRSMAKFGVFLQSYW
jgi:hypothetical protein